MLFLFLKRWLEAESRQRKKNRGMALNDLQTVFSNELD